MGDNELNDVDRHRPVADDGRMRQRLCLNMIVKDEAAVIERCLAAVAPYIDCFVICDTGSTDDTVALIKTFFASRNIPGVVIRMVFENFEQARNAALDAARDSALDFDYLLFCDADMELVVDSKDFRAELDGSSPYRVLQRNPSVEYTNVRLLPRHLAARFRGVTHEYLDTGPAKELVCGGIWFRDHIDGHSRPVKSTRDRELLTAGLEAEPDNSRYVFYLANAYYDEDDAKQALPWYHKRLQMGGWSEELFYSSYRVGLCLKKLGREAEMIARHLDTYQHHPHRAEPLHALALHYQWKNDYRLSYLIAREAATIPLPEDVLFVESDVYRWRILDIVAVSAFWLGHYAEGVEINTRLLEVVPESERDRVTANLNFCRNACS